MALSLLKTIASGSSFHRRAHCICRYNNMANVLQALGHKEQGTQSYEKALASYEALLRPFLAQKQQSARAFASSFAPETAFGIWLRRMVTKMMVIPPVADFFIGDSLKDEIDLPDYAF